MLSLDQAIAAVGKKIGDRNFNSEMNGGYGLSATLSPGEVLDIVYERKGTDRRVSMVAQAHVKELFRKQRKLFQRKLLQR